MGRLNLNLYEVEAYWGSKDGTLWHGTLEIEAVSMTEALAIARAKRLIPDDHDDHDLACTRDKYFEGHYDVEPIGEDIEAFIHDL